jgi:site-specific DNA recombinase
MKRTAIYSRVSAEDQVERYGLPVQLRACREYSEKNGLSIVAEISDEGISGTILDRPGLARIRAMARAREIDTVLMLDVDRLSRELAHLLILKPELESYVCLEFVTAKFEDSPSGRMFFGIRGVISQYERELTRERTMRGRKERAAAGLIVGGRVPYGYRYDQGHLVEDPDRVSVVRAIFADYQAGLSIRGITNRLRESGVPTWGGGRWAKSSVARILANETYAGVAHYGTHRREGKLLRLREGGERLSLAVPALVARDQWERVQARLNTNPHVGRPSPHYLLRGVLYCATCGRKMAGDNGHGNRTYRCTGRDRLIVSGEKCRNYARTQALDDAVWKALRRTFSDARFLREALGRREAELRNVDPGTIEAMHKLVAKLKRKEEAAVLAILDPDLAAERPRIKAQYKSTLAERRKVEIELTTLANERQSTGGRDWVEETAGMVLQFIGTRSDQRLKQEFVRRLVDRAEWDGEEIRMVCFIVPKMAQSSARYARQPLRPAAPAARIVGHAHRESRQRSPRPHPREAPEWN